MTYLRRLGAFLALFLATAGAFAAGGPATLPATSGAFGTFMATATGAGQTTVSFGTNGTPVASPSAWTITADGAKDMAVTANGTYKNPSGYDVPVTAKGRATASSVAKIIGKHAAAILGPISAGMMIWELCKELGYGCTWNGTKGVTVVKDDPTSYWCTTAPCSEYRAPYNTPTALPYVRSPQLACSDGNARRQSQDTGTFSPVTWTNPDTISYPYGLCTGTYVYPGFSPTAANFALQGRSRTPDTGPAPSMPSSLAELEASIASKSGWPSTSYLPGAFGDAWTATAPPAADAVPVPQSTVTVPNHPATSPASTETKTKPPNPDGSVPTETKTCVYNHNVQSAGLIQYTQGCTTATTNDGVAAKTTTTTSTTTDPQVSENQQTKEAEKAQCGVTGKPPCNVKVDESGMPTADMQTDSASRTLDQIAAMAANPASKITPHPVINWSFALPTGCSVIPTPAFAPALTQLDVCQFQPMFHDLMSIVWIMGGLFGAISLFMKNALAS